MKQYRLSNPILPLALLSAGMLAGALQAGNENTLEPLKWFYEELKENGRLDHAWMGDSGGASIESPQKKGGLRGVTISRTEFFEGSASLQFHVTKSTPDEWAFAAITNGDPVKGTEATSWKEVDAGKDISAYSHFTFYLKGQGDARIEMKDVTDQGSTKVRLSDYGTFDPDNWNKFSIPLKDLSLDQSLIDVTKLKNINILAEQDAPAGAGEWTFYMDNLSFEALEAPILSKLELPEYTGPSISGVNGVAYLTKIWDGNGKDKILGEKWGDDKLYDQNQDQGRVLLRQRKLPGSSKDSENTLKLTLYPDQVQQAVWGLGASMTDSSAYVLNELKQKNPALYEYTMKRLFSLEEGAGFNVIRLVVGASDYIASDTFYTYCDEKSEDLSKFSIDRDKAYLIPILKDALAINPDIIFFASPWSAPGWMKRNEDINGVSTEEKEAGTENRLKPEYIETFARYLTKFVQGYAEEGVHIQAVTLQNEPQFDAAHYPCMRVTQEDYVALIAAFGKATQRAGVDAKVLLHDHNWILHQNDTVVVGGDKKMDPLTLVEGLQSMKALAPYILGSAWHCYSGSFADMQNVYKSLRDDFVNDVIVTSEATAWKRDRSFKWNEDLFWGLYNNWYATFKYGGTAALQWNLVLDHKYGPSPRKDSEAYGIVTVNTDTFQESKMEREFYGMAHISKAIGGGGHLIEAVLHEDGKPSAKLRTLAFKRADGSVGLFVINRTGKSNANLTIEYRNHTFDVTIPKFSMATYIWSESK